jgi:hypothetical protein
MSIKTDDLTRPARDAVMAIMRNSISPSSEHEVAIKKHLDDLSVLAMNRHSMADALIAAAIALGRAVK